MAAPTVNHPQFIVFPTLNRIYVWKVVGVVSGRTISQHKDLAPAIEKAERLNNQIGVEQKAKVVCIAKGQLSERVLSDAYIRMQQDAYEHACDFEGEEQSQRQRAA